jgi:hypothetical protein
MEVEVHLVKRKIHLDGVFKLQLEFAVLVGDPDVAGLDGEIELAGANVHSGTKRFIRHAGGIWSSDERSNVLAKLVVLDVDRRQSQKDAGHCGENQNSCDETPER